MNMFYHAAILLVGLIVLWQSGYFAVKSAIEVSVVYGLESFTIGFFIFAISTGLPEIISAIVASVKDVPELSAGDLLGSSFVNLSLILGVTLILAGKIKINPQLKQRLMRTTLILIPIYISASIFPQMTRGIGFILIIIYFSSVFWLNAGIPKKEVSRELGEIKEKIKALEKKAILPLKLHVLAKLLISLAFLIFGSWITIQAATNLANLWDINLSIFGATLIAVGTGLPELALEIQAVKQKEYALALGDIFGSSLVNISLVLGMLILINPHLNLSFTVVILPFVLMSTGLIIWRLRQEKALESREGWIFITLFVLFIITAIGYEQFISS